MGGAEEASIVKFCGEEPRLVEAPPLTESRGEEVLREPGKAASSLSSLKFHVWRLPLSLRVGVRKSLESLWKQICGSGVWKQERPRVEAVMEHQENQATWIK